MFLPPRPATFVLLFGSGAIFPLGIAIAALLHERLVSNRNPLAQLMARCVLIVIAYLYAIVALATRRLNGQTAIGAAIGTILDQKRKHSDTANRD